ncbi:MAG: hypothetical protein ACFFA0_15335 [Promethearchaeota archaeon]
MRKITEELANFQTFKSYLFFWGGQLFSLRGSMNNGHIILESEIIE